MPDDTYSRRSILGLLGGALGATTLGAGVLPATGAEASQPGGAPEVQWYESYHGEQQDYELNRLGPLFETTDGYLSAGSGANVTKTGAENDAFALLYVGDGGQKRTVELVDPDREYSDHHTAAATRTSDGGYGLIGSGSVVLEDQRGEEVSIAVAAKTDSDGNEQWTATVDALQPDGTVEDETGPMPNAALGDVVPTDDGGLVAVGVHDDDGLFARFDADGNVVQERTYDENASISTVFDESDGYLIIGRRLDDTDRALRVSEQGEVRERFTLTPRVEGAELHGSPHYVRTDDGGFAYGASTTGPTNMVLGKLDAEGDYQWSQQYDGPYEAEDYLYDLIQTEDGGFALSGAMREAYSGDRRPALVKTDAEGNEEWKTLLTEAISNNALRLLQTEDSGFLVHVHDQLFKLGPTDAPESDTPTASPTDTPDGSTPSDTPPDAPDDQTPTDTPEEEPPAEEPEEPTSDPDDGAEAPADGSEDDCPETER